MSTFETGQLIYLVLLGAVLIGYYMTSHRKSLVGTARQVVLWILIFLGTIAVAGLWPEIRNSVLPRQAVVAGDTIEVPRAADGHYYLTLLLNDVPVPFVVDTGATDVVLTHSDARRIGIDPSGLPFTGRAGTANGMVRTARARVDSVRLGPVTDHGLTVQITDGDLFQSLLGMTYLQRFSRLEISGGTLILQR